MFRWGFLVIVCAIFSHGPMAWAKTKCSKGENTRKNCRLTWKKASYQFLNNQLSIDDGVWKEVVQLPDVGEPSEWKSMRVFEKAGRRFFEWKVWSAPKTKIEIQSLHWVLLEIENTKTHLRLNQVIQKRRSMTKQEADDSKKKKYLTDKMEKHRLTVRGKKLKWRVGAEKGEF